MKSAVLLIDLQRDFLAGPGARMPVSAQSTEQVLRVANAILAGRRLAESLRFMVVNEFPASAHVPNFFRRHAAIAGSQGAELDPRLDHAENIKRISKSSASAFTNPELNEVLRASGTEHLYVLGVMTEGCVRATVVDAIRRGFRVTVIDNGIASNAEWKHRLGVWLMKRAGAEFEGISVDS